VWPELGREIDFARDVTGMSMPVHLHGSTCRELRARAA
jgi:hypothetical protein